VELVCARSLGYDAPIGWGFAACYGGPSNVETFSRNGRREEIARVIRTYETLRLENRLPEEARRPNGEIWLVRDGRLVILRPRPVEVVGGRAVFESGPSGLVAGDKVVVSQLTHPRDGMAVADMAGEPAATAAPAAATTSEGRDDT
jgi:hypothetical protein